MAETPLYAKVREDSRLPIITAGGGQEFIRREFRSVVAGTEKEIEAVPFLETTYNPPKPAPVAEPVTPEAVVEDPATLPADLHSLKMPEVRQLAVKFRLPFTEKTTKGELVSALEALRPETGTVPETEAKG